MHIVLLCCGILAGCGIVDSFLSVNPRAAEKRDLFGSTAAFGKRGYSGESSLFDTTASFGKRDPHYAFYDNSAGFGKRGASSLLDASAGFGKRGNPGLKSKTIPSSDDFFLESTAALGRR